MCKNAHGDVAVHCAMGKYINTFHLQSDIPLKLVPTLYIIHKSYNYSLGYLQLYVYMCVCVCVWVLLPYIILCCLVSLVIVFSCVWPRHLR